MPAKCEFAEAREQEGRRDRARKPPGQVGHRRDAGRPLPVGDDLGDVAISRRMTAIATL